MTCAVVALAGSFVLSSLAGATAVGTLGRPGGLGRAGSSEGPIAGPVASAAHSANLDPASAAASGLLAELRSGLTLRGGFAPTAAVDGPGGGSHGARASPAAYGTAVDYLTADSTAQAAAHSYLGGGWNVWFAVGFANNVTTLLSLPSGSGSCPVTNITAPPSGELVFPPTSPAAVPGTSAGWGFILSQAAGTTLLFDAVVNNSATLILTMPTDCFRLQSNQAVPEGVINSTTAAAAAGSVGGSAFLTQFPGANRTYELVSNSSSSPGPNFWGVIYQTAACYKGEQGVFEAVVNSLNGTIDGEYNSTSACTFPVTFEESGLAAGIGWSVDVGGPMYGATAPGAVRTQLPNGNYSFTITPPSGYRVSPASGHFNVSGAPVSIVVVFSLLAGYYTITFTEHGVPNGSANWNVNLQNRTGFWTFSYSSGGVSVAFAEPNGSYNFSVGVQTGRVASVPSAGMVNVTGANVTVALAFVPGYLVTFEESGLPTGTFWSVTLNGSDMGSSGSEVNFTVTNDSYPFTVNALYGFTASPAGGSVKVTGSDVLQPVAFALQHGFYVLTFTERGLPSHSPWVANVRNATGVYSSGVSNGETSISLAETNDSYTYSVDVMATGWGPSPYAGAVRIDGANVTVPLTFLPGYVVSFTETGLAPGAFWSVQLTNSQLGGNSAWLNVTEPNGTWAYSISGPGGFVAVPGIGDVHVDGAAVVVPIAFTPPSGLSTVMFNQTGLPGGTLWWVNLTVEPSVNSTGPSLTIALPNGTYPYTIASANKLYAAAGGSLDVKGSALYVSVAFSLVTYLVTFTETGLLPSTQWWVNGTALGSFNSTATTIAFPEPNGSYPYTVATTDKELAAPGGTVVVHGAPATPSVTFTAVTYRVTFTESGLPAGTEWWVNGTLLGSHSSTTSTVVLDLTNGSYPYAVAMVAELYESAEGTVVVNGAPQSVAVPFTLVTYAVTFTETGLPLGTSWWVNGTVLGSHTSQTATIVVELSNATYSFRVATTDKEFAAGGGSVVVSGAAVPKAVAFAPVLYALTFTETGLSAGTNWSIRMAGVTHYSTGTSIVVEVHNGSWSFNVTAISGFSVNPANGTLLVNGGPVGQPLAFTSNSQGATFLGMPAVEGYAVVGGIVVVALAAGLTAGLLARRRARAPAPPAESPPSVEPPKGPA